MNKLLTVVLLIHATMFLDSICASCPTEKPYYISEGGNDKLCFKSCEEIKFGNYRAVDPYSFACYSVPSNNFTGSKELDVQKRLNTDAKQVCNVEAVAMFFSWVAYEHDPPRMTGLSLSEKLGYRRLSGCGTWKIMNEIHNQNNLLNSHATLAVNEERGVIVLAFRGTEMSENRWKQNFIDWVFNDFYTILVPCTIITECSKSKIHAGFQRSISFIGKEILSMVKPYLHAGYLLILTGHSKGSAMSTVATLMTVSTFRKQIPDIEKRIYNMNFASPMVGDQDFVDIYNSFIPDNRTVRYNARFYGIRQIDDIVTQVPATFLGYRHIKNARYIKCERKYFGNPDPIPGIHTHINNVKFMPVLFGCHFQEVYLDGLLYGPNMTVELLETTAANEVGSIPIFDSECQSFCHYMLEDSSNQEKLACTKRCSLILEQYRA